MSTIETLIQSYTFNRGRTLALLDAVEKESDPQGVLGWRPGPGRAHIGWQLTHIAVTEEIFATERLAPERESQWTELWPRFRGGSTPDDNVPATAQIRQLLVESRTRLLETLRGFAEGDLGQIPPALAERGWTLRTVLDVIGWHEAHHQGQAHLTMNLYRATRG